MEDTKIFFSQLMAVMLEVIALLVVGYGLQSVGIPLAVVLLILTLSVLIIVATSKAIYNHFDYQISWLFVAISIVGYLVALIICGSHALFINLLWVAIFLVPGIHYLGFDKDWYSKWRKPASYDTWD